MKAFIISEQKTSELNKLLEAFRKHGFEKISFINIEKVCLLTKENKTSLFAGKKNLANYDCCYLKASPDLIQFIEPFLDELVEQGIYCQFKPESFYFNSNKAMQFTSLNSKKIPIPKTVIIADTILSEDAVKKLSFPLNFKAFKGNKKTHSLIVESERSLKSLLNSIKTEIDFIIIQEYLEGDLFYCAVIGEEVFSFKRKWDAKKSNHSPKGISTSLSEEEKQIPVKACKVLGMDLGTVKMINGKILDVFPEIDFEKFNHVLSKNLYGVVGKHFEEKVR